MEGMVRIYVDELHLIADEIAAKMELDVAEVEKILDGIEKKVD